MDAFLKDAVASDWSSLDYVSSDMARENTGHLLTVIHLIGGLVGAIFGFAGILNLINTLVTTILTRRHEFATMQSIGMTAGQLRDMMMWEGIFYAAGSCVMGLILSAVLGVTLIRGLIEPNWMFTFHFTLLPAAAACAAFLILGAVIPAAALKAFHKGSIIEKLRAAE